MGVLLRKRVGGGLVLLVAGWLGRESLSWLFGKALDLVGGKVSDVNLAMFPWQNAIAALLALLGAYLAFWPGNPKAKPASRSDRLLNLHYKGGQIVDRVRYSRQLQWFQRGRGEETSVDIARDGISVLLDYRNEGLPTPQFGSMSSAEKLCVGMEAYFSALGPFMRDGHVAQVDAMIADVAERALETATGFNPDNWYVERY